MWVVGELPVALNGLESLCHVRGTWGVGGLATRTVAHSPTSHTPHTSLS